MWFANHCWHYFCSCNVWAIMSYIKSPLHQGIKYVLHLGSYVIHIGLITHKSSSQKSLAQRPGLNFGFYLAVTEHWCSSFLPVLTHLILRNVYYIHGFLSEHTILFSPLSPSFVSGVIMFLHRENPRITLTYAIFIFFTQVIFNVVTIKQYSELYLYISWIHFIKWWLF